MRIWRNDIKNGADFWSVLTEICNSAPTWVEYQAAYWIFIEDGGKMVFEDFLRIAPPSPIPYIETRMLDLIDIMMVSEQEGLLN